MTIDEQAAALSAMVVYRTAEYRQLREKCRQLEAENRELANARPLTRAAVYRSVEYRKLRAKCEELERELREKRKAAKNAGWSRDLTAWAREHVERAQALLDSLVPRDELLNPDNMIEWHVREALCWATVQGGGAFRLKRVVDRFARDELPDPKREGAYVPAALRRALMARGVCVECSATSDLTIDHIHPVALGGRSTRENLQVLCGRCNSRKGARLPATNGLPAA